MLIFVGLEGNLFGIGGTFICSLLESMRTYFLFWKLIDIEPSFEFKEVLFLEDSETIYFLSLGLYLWTIGITLSATFYIKEFCDEACFELLMSELVFIDINISGGLYFV